MGVALTLFAIFFCKETKKSYKIIDENEKNRKIDGWKPGNFQPFFSSYARDNGSGIELLFFFVTEFQILGQLKFNATDNQFIFSLSVPAFR